MNNDKNPLSPEEERLAERFLTWLLQEVIPDDDQNVGAGIESHRSPFQNRDHDPSSITDESTMQNRFQALLKRRIQQEIQENPPLFPWETTEVWEYANDPVDEEADSRVPIYVWLPQLQHLRLPVAISDVTFAQLFVRCQQLLRTSLRQGERLVAAVEGLFPEQTEELNLWTERVLLWSTSRSSKTLIEPSEGEFPSSYEGASPKQQMLLSLLAAKEIVESLSLNVSASHPRDRRQWLTAQGLLQLEVEYRCEAELPQLRVCCQIPDGGRVQLRGEGAIATGQRSTPGSVTVELADIQLHQTYTLEVHLDVSEQSPLVFAICPTA
ncbi:PatU [Sodalinema gerasimenkoae]|uniref:PatU n=1 Tax=Sodalinema gerasimenkoae TaxID=2862348 RepID=UPI00135A3B91|nr:PatU [Sodalinema gerasimenkoae]